MRTAEPMLVAEAIVLALGWMSYVASRHAAFPRLGALLLYLLGLSLAAGLLTSPTLWLIGAMAPTLPVAHHVMMWQNHRVLRTALEAQSENRRLSMHDPLTALPNRLMLAEWMSIRVAHAAAGRASAEFAVLCLDLDGFKPINDTHGHPTGDTLLRLVAERLRSSLRDDGVLCRTGGDEFVALIENISRVDALRVAQRLIAACCEHYDLGAGRLVRLGVSVGIAMYPHDASDPDTVLALADAVFDESKQTRRGSCSVHGCAEPAVTAREPTPASASLP